MSGNTTGKLFSVTTFGESHGVAMGCIVDGCPPGMDLTEADIQVYLDKRKPGSSKFTTQRKEDDKVEILSGVFEGKTTGTPIGLLIRNKDQKSKDYEKLKDVFRPSHADYSYTQKYGIRDHRGGGRASARETTMRVAAGSIARKYLKESSGIEITGYLSQIGNIKINEVDLNEIDKNPFFSPDKKIIPEIEKLINKLREEGDSIGAKITVNVTNLPPGLGEPVFDKLDSEIAKALMGINAVKGVEIGAGFSVIEAKGSESRDEMSPEGFKSNSSGGTSGGISTGQDLIASIALKPTSSIAKEGDTVDKEGKAAKIKVTGRHDPCVGIRATPIAESMVALVLIDHLLRNSYLLYIDRHLIHEVTSPQAFEGLRVAGRKPWRTSSNKATPDHNIPTTDRQLGLKGIKDEVSKLQVTTLDDNCKEHGIEQFDIEDERQGIVHVVGPEQGITLPGMTVVCGDSHTSTHGALGSLAMGIGTSEVEHVLATQCLVATKQKNMNVQINNVLPKGVYSKDLTMSVIGKIGTAGATGYAIEYSGKAIESMSIEARMTVCNMAIEAGARAGMVAFDEITLDYVKGKPYAPSGTQWDNAIDLWKDLKTDLGAHFDETIKLDASELKPQVSWGTSPEMVIDIDSVVPEPKSNSESNALDYMGIRIGIKGSYRRRFRSSFHGCWI